ncbi:MAG: HEAT repeat domain-containing protein [Planctomycetota bacterium]|nr:HEAT repeat domain-containing protein [Planctomycetota bacterium]
MKNTPWPLLGALCGLLVTCTVWADETAPVSALIESLQSKDLAQRRNAAYDLDQLGKQAAPAVAALTAALDDADQQVWSRSASALAGIGAAAEPAIPKLVAALPGGGQRAYRYGYALSQIGAAALPALLETLQHEKPAARGSAARSLGWMGPPAATAVTDLLGLLEDADISVQHLAAAALGRIGSIPPLVETLAHESPARRRGAAAALGQMATPPADALPALVKTFQDTDDTVRAQALATVGNFGTAAAPHLPQLVAAITDAQANVRAAAVTALTRARPHSLPAVPLLVPHLSHERPEVALTAARALGRFGAAAKTAIPALIAALPNIDPELDNTTFPLTFRRIGPDSIAPLTATLKSDNPRLLTLAATSLGRFGSRAEAARPALEPHREHTDPAVSAAVQGALAKIGDPP